MTKFEVFGPLKLPVTQRIGGKEITSSNIGVFWRTNSSHARKRGCCVFGMRAGKGIVPWYVGKTTKGFEDEIFPSRQNKEILRCNDANKKGRTSLFLCLLPPEEGKNKREADWTTGESTDQARKIRKREPLEQETNPRETWSIGGVYRSAAGKPSAAAQSLRNLLDFV